MGTRLGGNGRTKGGRKERKRKKERDWAEREKKGKHRAAEDQSGPGPRMRGREGRLAFLGLGFCWVHLASVFFSPLLSCMLQPEPTLAHV